jgi:acetyl-CoA carboxylase biotin carboxyl carrier protein
MDLRKLKTLIDLVSESNVSELEITEAEGKVRIVKSEPHATVAYHAPATSAPLAAAPVAAAPAPVPVVEAPPAAPVATAHLVKSPMVGTFYRAASPGADPFVDVGASVKVGQRLCIVEAMKILNEIESDRAGVIKTVLVQDGEAVEYGQPLFEIE